MHTARKSLMTVVALSMLLGLVAFVTPTQSQGPGTSNPQPLNVNVMNTPTVREASKQPFNDTIQSTIGDGAAAAAMTMTVPAGKQLVVTYVSGDVNLLVGQTASFNLRAGGNSSDAVLHKLASDSVEPTREVVNEAFQLYLNAGETLSLQVRRSDTVGVGAITFNVSGYLLPLSQ